MKLYNANLSPYSARVRLQLYAKGLQAEFAPPPGGGVHTPEFAGINPLERLPALDDGGFIIPESGAIVEYIEDAYPNHALRPVDVKERARMRVLYDIADHYTLPSLFKLFGQVNPATRDAKIVDAALTDLAQSLKGLDHYLVGGGKYALGSALTLADCALVPALFFVGALAPAFGQGDLMNATSKVKTYFAAVQADANVTKLIKELSDALAERLKSGR